MKILITCFSIVLLTQVAFSSEILSNFGSSSFIIDQTWTTYSPIQDSNSVSISGPDSPDNIVYGSFIIPFTVLDLPSSYLSLNFAINGSNPDSAFHIDLYNSDETAWYTFTGTTEGVTSIASNVALEYYDLNGDPFNQVSKALIAFDGLGSNIDMNLNNISVVPEPGTYLLLAVAGLFIALNSFRRRTRH